MSMQIRDQYHGDPTLTVLLAALEDRPLALEAVKTASFDPGAAERLPATAFAWEEERRFPIHTREDTIASIAYRAKVAGYVPDYVDEKLADAAEAYDIPAEMFTSSRLVEKIAAEQVPLEYAVPSQQRLPLGSDVQIKVAEEVLLRDGHVLPLDERVEAWGRVQRAAASRGVKLAAEADVYAGQRVCYTHTLRDRIGMRAATTKVAELAAAYDAMDTALNGVGPVLTDQEALVKLASRLHEMDKVAGIDHLYGKKIFDPMKTVFNGQEKIAARVKTAEEACDLAGRQVPVSRLMQLPPEVWQQVDVPELAQVQDPQEFKVIFDTLPLDIKMVLAKQL